MQLNLESEFLRKIKFKKVVYPVVMVILVIIVVLIFSSTTVFLSDAINRSFSLDESLLDSRIIKINFENLKLVAQKLNITIAPEPEGNAPVAVPPEPAMQAATGSEPVPGDAPSSTLPVEASQSGNGSASTTLPGEASTTVPLDKKALNISILNSSGVAGRAAALKDYLAGQGFPVGETGNTKPAQKLTSIRIKDSKKEYIPLLREALSSKYDLGEDSVLEEGSKADAVVIIGTDGLR